MAVTIHSNCKWNLPRNAACHIRYEWRRKCTKQTQIAASFSQKKKIIMKKKKNLPRHQRPELYPVADPSNDSEEMCASLCGLENQFKRNRIKIRRASNWNRIPKTFYLHLIVALRFHSVARFRRSTPDSEQINNKMFALNQLLRFHGDHCADFVHQPNLCWC